MEVDDVKLLTALMTVSLVFGATTAVADDHGHGEFPEGTLLALEGRDAISKAECFLFVLDVGYSGPENAPEQFYAKVSTSYSHGHDAAAPIVVKTVAGKPNVLVGTGDNGKDQVAVIFDQGVTDLRDAKAFNIKWWHSTHFHTNRCENLSVHEH